MKKILSSLSLLLCMGINQAHAQSPRMEWMRQIGDTSHETGMHIVADMLGNVITVGTFEGECDFDPYAGVSLLTSEGMKDIFITKHDRMGVFMWAKRIGGPYDDIAHGVEVDPSGNIYVSGSFSFYTDFDPNAGSFFLSTAGGPDCFQMRLDGAGMFNWARSRGTVGPDSYFGTVFGTGNIYHIGYYTNVTKTGALGASGIIIDKANASNGALMYSKTIEGDAINSNKGCIAIDNLGNVVAGGSFAGSVAEFPLITGNYRLIPIGGADGFIVKVNSLGNMIWAKHFSGTGEQIVNGVATDVSGNIYVTGTFTDRTDFNPATGTSDTMFITPKGTKDMFIVKLNSSGGFIWAMSFGAPGESCSGNSIKTDPAGSIYTAGSFSGTVDFNPDTTTQNITSNGGNDMFVMKLSSAKELKWVKRFGGKQDDVAKAMFLNTAAEIFTTGMFSDTVNFNPIFKPQINKIAAGNTDLFVHKMIQCVQFDTLVKDIFCGNFTLDDVVYTESGKYNQTIVGVSGCEENYSLDLDIRIINDTISKTGVVLSSHQKKGADIKYQWLICPSNKIIPGATADQYIALGNGQYKVVVSNGPCSDTSDCIAITGMVNSIEEYMNQQLAQVYPNPSNGTFVIEINEQMTGAEASIFNMMGQKVRTIELNQTITQQSLNTGFYIIEIKKGEEKITKRFVVN